MRDKHLITEEPCELKDSRTVLKTSGFREELAEFNQRLAKSINDVGWTLFRQWLEYNAFKFNTAVVAVNPKMTSQKCSDCGAIVKKSLSTRTHKCKCGCKLQRDVNAAINILNRGIARDGQSRSNATEVATSTLLGANLVEQVATVNVESPGFKSKR